MFLRELSILNYKNIRDANLHFSDKLNCFVGLNGQGKTNFLDAIYYLSFTKSAYNTIDSQNITHGEEMTMIQGLYNDIETAQQDISISCGIKKGGKKQFRRGKKDYRRLIDHIGLIPLVMICPRDSELISEGSEDRRRFMDGVISQYDRTYLEHFTQYNLLLKQRNALLKQYSEPPINALPTDLFGVIEEQMAIHANYIYAERKHFIHTFSPYFQEVYTTISAGQEQAELQYVSQLHEKDLQEALLKTRTRDLILGWTSQGIHKDELEMLLDGYSLKRVGSQGQQKTYLLAMKLGQALYLGEYEKESKTKPKPILLLDDIFDKLDSQRMERIVKMIDSSRFGQIFITDTDRQHLSDILQDMSANATIFYVQNGTVQQTPYTTRQ